ncbi:MAG TPA: SAM-dependent methyltransferase [Ferrovibrio sp.]|uniref:SAM-dependent methyltransferase n=1 Tax=Ferrovibrio sp. TaxID=1917215 RepID=UPI002ED3A123
MITGYLAAEGLEDQLRKELAGRIMAEHGRLLLCDGEGGHAAWAANIWFDVREIAIESIGDAAAKLKGIQRNWVAYAPLHHRRARLIVEKLPHVSAKPLVFGAPLPAAPLGSFTLLAPDRMLYAARCSSPVPHGEYGFVEDRSGPPNRAYLKLWEALTRFGELPKAGDVCLDLGASPGGWSWVLAQCGARVTAIDKAPLAAAVAAMPNVAWQQGSAFALEPREFKHVDWLCSDVICYPARLLKLVERWLAAGNLRRAICTLKFQGETDHETARAFAAIPGSRLLHLHHNKHELTWLWSRPQ